MREPNPRQTEQLRERVLGCMVGGAVGDALGYAVEFSSWPQIQRQYGPEGIKEYELDRHGLACISDDTQMSLFTAAGTLLGMTRGHMRGIMGRLDTYCEKTYVDWLHTQEWPCRKADTDYERSYTWLMDIQGLYARRAPGNTCLSALHAIENGRPVENNSCGCGGVMRTAPIALISYVHGYEEGNPAYVDHTAAGAARITHKHPLGFIPSAVLNRVLMMILGGEVNSREDLQRAFLVSAKEIKDVVSEEDGKHTYGQLWPVHCYKMETIICNAMRHAGCNRPDVEAIEMLGGGWTGHDALAIAAYSAVKHYGSFEDSIISAVNHSGDSDSTGAICGNIAGCLYGRSAIPAKFTEHLELLDIIDEISQDLFTGCIISEYDPIDTPEKERWLEKYCHCHWTPRGRSGNSR